MIEEYRQRLSAYTPGPFGSDEVDRRVGITAAQPHSTMSSDSEFHLDSDPPTLQIRDQRRAKDSSLPRTPSPDVSVVSSETEVSPSMRMEMRQKRRVIEEVAVYDSKTFYENQSPKRPRHRVDRSPVPAAVRVEPPGTVAQPVVQVSSSVVKVPCQPTPSTSAQPARTFAVTGTIQVCTD